MSDIDNVEIDNPDVEQEATDDTVEVGDTVDESEPQAEIPDELAGLDESFAREAMEEAGIEVPAENEEAEEDSISAEADSVNKQDDVLPNQSIPYKRFKQQVDKNHKLEEQLEQLKQQLEARQQVQNVQPAPQQPQAMMNTVNVQQTGPQTAQQPLINAEVMKQLKQVVDQETMKMTGMSQDDVEALEYMDDDDTRKQTWNTARKFAEAQVFQKVQEARNMQLAESRRKIAVHNENVLRYNEFARKQMEDPNFKAIQSYAINDYFSSRDKHDQEIIAGAYSRIQNNAGSPTDTMIIRDYFTAAKNAYNRAHGSKKTTNSEKNTVIKVKQGQAFPRSGDIEGASSDPGAVTVETLERMLDTTPFEKIPKEYQDILLGLQ